MRGTELGRGFGSAVAGFLGTAHSLSRGLQFLILNRPGFFGSVTGEFELPSVGP